ncbi:4,5-dihydroxyphthalate decarboxylase [Thalassoglobus neptunius]|uniref:4,5-dihydroxyphthalate decarboxylase n=1 Tax=Thalassoglobus neptunius TaxID=1938619 RepID=A0A5C5W963_9PLAN|nr:ABC transporter substrate-binding protein [Thalassoglobus neptunius]TWT47154.1 4,5-dihydroxyphthalate decarboxylase [Thalassoglobus neptunius]
MNLPDINRRDLLKTTGLAAGAGALGLAQSSQANEAKAGKHAITAAGYKYDRVLPIADGKVGIEGFEVNYEPDKIGNLNTHIFVGPRTREVTEVGLHPFMLAYANEAFRNYSLLPIFPLRTFRHKSIFIRTDRGIEKPEDLKGRKVGTPGFSSTSLTWLRGILEHEYGLKPTDVEWVVSAKDSGSDTAGVVSKLENVIPEGLSISTGSPGKDESELLVNGEVDALFHALEPKAFVEGNPIVGRLFPDFRRTEQAYYTKTGIFPIMHAVAIRNDFAEKHPELPLAVCRAYSEAKRLALAELHKLGWANISLPWVAKEIEDTRKMMGDNFWPYGIKGNEKTLNALFKYSHEQGLAGRRLRIEDLFHPATLEFAESG